MLTAIDYRKKTINEKIFSSCSEEVYSRLAGIYSRSERVTPVQQVFSLVHREIILNWRNGRCFAFVAPSTFSLVVYKVKRQMDMDVS